MVDDHSVLRRGRWLDDEGVEGAGAAHHRAGRQRRARRRGRRGAQGRRCCNRLVGFGDAMTTKTIAYARSHTAAYVSDKIAGLMKRLVNAFGFDPRAVVDAWTDWVDHTARTW